MTELINSIKQDFFELRSNIRFEFLKNYRRKKMLIILSTAVILGLLFYLVPLLSDGDFPDEVADYLSNNLGFVNLILILNAIFLGSDAINREHASKTSLLVYPLPQRTTIVIVAKYITQLLSSWLSIVFYYAVTSLTVVLIYGFDAIPSEIWRSLMFAMLFMSSLLAFAFLLSSIFKSPPTSMTMTFFGLFLFLPILNMVLGLIDVDTSWILTNYSGFITDVFQFPSGDGFGPGAGQTDLDFNDGIKYLVAYTLGFFTATVGLGLNKEVS